MNESLLHLKKAGQKLEEAEVLLEHKHYEAAGCNSYLAAYHAALAYLQHKTQATAKTHSGVHSLFHQTAKDDPRISDELRRFLGYAYNLKAIADYELGPGAEIPEETAQSAFETALRFVQCIEKIVTNS